VDEDDFFDIVSMRAYLGTWAKGSIASRAMRGLGLRYNDPLAQEPRPVLRAFYLSVVDK